MKKTQVALAALALVASTAALADGVTIYGTADLSIVNTKSGTGMGGLGNSAGSIFGFRASEDLGGGLKAGANFEGGVHMNTGLQGGNGAIAGNVFNRQANVTLGTDNIGLTVGTQLSPFIGGILTGATAVGGNGVFVPGILRVAGGGSGLAEITTGSVGTQGFFIPDAVNLNLAGSGFNANVLYRVKPSQAAKESSYTAANLSTSVAGINLAVAYQSQQTEAADSVSSIALAANTNIGDVRLNAMVSDNRDKGATGNTNGYLLGVSTPIAGALSAGLTYVNNTKLGSGSQTSASLQYDLSKRTHAYATYSSFSKESTGAAMANDNAGQTGKYAIIVGLAHSF